MVYKRIYSQADVPNQVVLQLQDALNLCVTEVVLHVVAPLGERVVLLQVADRPVVRALGVHEHFVVELFVDDQDSLPLPVASTRALVLALALLAVNTSYVDLLRVQHGLHVVELLALGLWADIKRPAVCVEEPAAPCSRRRKS